MSPLQSCSPWGFDVGERWKGNMKVRGEEGKAGGERESGNAACQSFPPTARVCNLSGKGYIRERAVVLGEVLTASSLLPPTAEEVLMVSKRGGEERRGCRLFKSVSQQ
ncbi:Hypothetical predicted protein [Xyrichtys novacula]|uniref:Uncharacterized protein n=1 Tax=Xyrichtys novacula TaxID=13765 RepID=A0AAV1G656_XYRNO|nr:Hypothetical predicted protein [Xyrichtys novacula]